MWKEQSLLKSLSKISLSGIPNRRDVLLFKKLSEACCEAKR
jgi:hypothetical protein